MGLLSNNHSWDPVQRPMDYRDPNSSILLRDVKQCVFKVEKFEFTERVHCNW